MIGQRWYFGHGSVSLEPWKWWSFKATLVEVPHGWLGGGALFLLALYYVRAYVLRIAAELRGPCLINSKRGTTYYTLRHTEFPRACSDRTREEKRPRKKSFKINLEILIVVWRFAIPWLGWKRERERERERERCWCMIAYLMSFESSVWLIQLSGDNVSRRDWKLKCIHSMYRDGVSSSSSFCQHISIGTLIWHKSCISIPTHMSD